MTTEKDAMALAARKFGPVFTIDQNGRLITSRKLLLACPQYKRQFAAARRMAAVDAARGGVK